MVFMPRVSEPPEAPAEEPTVEIHNWVDANMEGPRYFESFAGPVGVFCAPSPDLEEAHETNEDSAALVNGAGDLVLAVADGAGGMAGGGMASALAMSSLVGSIEDCTGLREGILQGFEDAQDAVLSLEGPATTLLAVEVGPGWLRPYHAGDSQAILVGPDGWVKLETFPHTPSHYAVEAGLLEEEDELALEHRHLVANALGADPLRIETYNKVITEPGDTLVLGSDGLFDNLSVEEVATYAMGESIEDIMVQLVKAAQRRMMSTARRAKPDDLAVLALRFN